MTTCTFLEDFFSDPKWSRYSNENHKASYLDKGHSVVRGNMKDHILRKLSTDYHLPIEIVGKKDDKKIKMSSKRSIPLPTSNHDLRKLRGKTKYHDMAVVGFRNYIVMTLSKDQWQRITSFHDHNFRDPQDLNNRKVLKKIF